MPRLPNSLAERILIVCRANLAFLLLLTATPHEGDPENFSLFLQLGVSAS